MATDIPEPLLRGIVATYAPQRVILFGSAARADAKPDSDLDLLVVLDDDAPKEAFHWSRVRDARRDFRGALDLVACRAGTLARRALAPGSFAATILREGVVVYDRPGP